MRWIVGEFYQWLCFWQGNWKWGTKASLLLWSSPEVTEKEAYGSSREIFQTSNTGGLRSACCSHRSVFFFLWAVGTNVYSHACCGSASDPFCGQKGFGCICPFSGWFLLVCLFRQGFQVYSSDFLNIYQLLKNIFVKANLIYILKCV